MAEESTNLCVNLCTGSRTDLPLVSTMLALSRGSTFLLHLEKGSVGMSASRYTMALDTRRTGKLLVVDEDHGAKGGVGSEESRGEVEGC